jgi:penicillin amidase
MTHRHLLAFLSLTSFLLSARFVPAAETADSLLKKARAVLAQLDGDLTVAGLKEPVEVLRDRWGVPHIYAKNTDDLFFAQGFVTAQDRLFQMDLWRRVAIGETAEVSGLSGINTDRIARLLLYRGDLDAEWASYGPEARKIATAFTSGINAYIDHLGERLPVEFQLLGVKPKRWKPEDCLGRMSGIIMTRNFLNEIERADLINAAGLAQARKLAPTDPIRDFGPVDGFDLTGIGQEILANYRQATRPLRFQLGSDGSNNWVIDGSLSASGKPLLANDPHRPISLPSLRYLVHLHAPGWNVIGAGEPALPGVALGHNERIAWGFTIVGTDQSDVYVEETNPADPSEYKVGDRWEKMKVVREKVPVKGQAAPHELELRFTRHGPVIHQDPKRNRAYALKWVGSEPGGAAYLGGLAVSRSGNWREFVEALKAWKLPSENMVYADVDGNIGWVATALTPLRKGWDGLLPVPGAGGKYEWQGFLALKDLPQAFNPQSHWIATANHNILPAGYGHEIAYEWAPSYRFAQVRRRLEARKKFDLEDFKSIQHDNTTLVGQELIRLVKTVDMQGAALKPSVELLESWDGVLSRDSRAGPLYGFWLQELMTGFYGRYVPEPLLSFLSGRRGAAVMLAALAKPDKDWFGDDPVAARDQLVRETFARAVKKTEETLPGGPDKWTWGRLHTATFRHPLAGLGAEYEKAFNLGPVGTPGDSLTPNAAGHDPRFQQLTGASYRQLFDLADWDRGLATSVPGQSGQAGSPHYADLLPLWEKGEYFPLAYSRGRVDEVTRHRLRLNPVGK